MRERPPGTRSKRKLATAIVWQIRKDIIDLGWPLGHLLGSEAELIKRYGVSRAVLREAIRLLEHLQVAEMRRGPGGGLVVKAPAGTAVADTLALCFEFVGISPAELFETRRVLDSLVIRLAAERLTEEGIAQLRAAMAAETVEDPRSLSVHETLARLSRNDVLVPLVQAVGRTTSSYFEQLANMGEQATDELLECHRVIGEAVIAGDFGLAEHAVVRHLDSMLEWLRSRDNRQTRRRRKAPPPRGTANGRVQIKLPERISRHINADIRRRAWYPGEVAGSESKFLEDYQISRAVFREAVRILEFYGVAEMRRGPGGGLVVREPDPTDTVEAVTTYLDFLRVDPAHVWEARHAVELACTQLAARRITPEGGARLRRLVASEEALRTCASGLHPVIGELAGNRPLQLFARILTAADRKPATDCDGMATAEAGADELAGTHANIGQAILAGDAGLARHRMMRHLAEISPAP